MNRYIVYGYHGCDKHVCDKILKNKEAFRHSINDYDWLGKGIYFWENNPLRALEWAKKNSTTIKNPTVIEATISLENCWDLSRMDHMELLVVGYQIFEIFKKISGKPIPENLAGFKDDIDKIKRYKDCEVVNFVYNFYCSKYAVNPGEKQNKKFEVIRSAFSEGNQIYPGTCWTEKQHIQLCVRNINCILNMRELKEW